jgi:branched-chain amino acid transport system substrate-binding protein
MGLTNYRRFATAAALAAMMLSATSCVASSGGASSTGNATTSKSAKGIPDGPIIIGLPVALSGVINLYDSDLVIGAQMTAKKINNAGGIDGHQIKLVLADTHSDIAQGGAAADKVIDQGAQFIIPTLDYNYGGGAAREAMKHRLIAVSQAADLRFALPIGPYMFNMYGGGPNEGAVPAVFAEQQGYKRVYLLTDTSITHETSVCGAFKDVAKKLGIDVVGSGTFAQGDASIATQVTAIRAAQSNLDAVMMCSYPPGGTSALRQLRSGGITKPILLDTTFDNNEWEKALPNPGQLYIVSVGPVTAGQNPDKASAQVYADYAAYTGHPLKSAALSVLTGVSAVQVIADAVKATNSVDSTVIKAYLETYKNHPLAIGSTTWTPTCHVAEPRPMQIARIENGVEAYVKTVTPTTLPDKTC